VAGDEDPAGHERVILHGWLRAAMPGARDCSREP
jgi:hypothetical protein